MEPRCVFCAIIEENEKKIILYHNEYLVVIKDIKPLSPIHYLIIPRKHLINIREMDEHDASYGHHIFLMAHKLSRLSAAHSHFQLKMNNGMHAGQKIFHMHAHFMA